MKRFFRNNGLSIVWFGLFFSTFIIGQTLTGQHEYNDDQREHGQPEVSYVEYLTTPHFLEATMENWESEFLRTSAFWFQSFQNWQSEFLAVFSIVVLSIFLRQRGSPESKPVAAPHSKTGDA